MAEGVAGNIKNEAKDAIKNEAKKIIKRYGWTFFIELIPCVGWLWPGNIILVWRTMKGDITGPEGIFMMTIAVIAYFAVVGIGIIEFFVDLGIFTTLADWLIGGFFVLWIEIFHRSGGAHGTNNDNIKEKQEDSKSQTSAPQKSTSSTSTAK